jgi:hypothetical protein
METPMSGAPESPTPSTPELDVSKLGYGDLGLSEERIAYLKPRLAWLLADFAKLEAIARPEIEPAMTPDLEGYDRERH